MSLPAAGTVICVGVQAGDRVRIGPSVILTASGSQTPGGLDFDETAGTDELVAASLAAAINDPANGLNALVFAGTGGTSTVTIISVTPGLVGNSVELLSSAPTRLVLSGDFLSGGFQGGTEYGYSAYGSMAFPRPPYPVDGGYGGAPYGLGPYGSIDHVAPRITGCTSLDGTHIEVFFSEEMLVDDVFCDPTNYTIAAFIGVPTVTVTFVEPGVPGTAHGSSATSAIITHTGTTLGGDYEVTVVNVTDLALNPIDELVTNRGRCLTFGDIPTYTVTPIAGDTLRVQFDHDMLTEAAFSPGIEDPAAYGIETAYPIPITVTDILHPVGGDPSVVNLTVQGMTSTSYTTEIAPSLAIDYLGAALPSASTEFSGVEIGTGSSTAGPATGLLLTKNSGSFYGWGFGDTSGRVLPSSTYRVDYTFDASLAGYSPALFDSALGTFSISDGVVQVNLTLTRVGGIDNIVVTSGAYSASIPTAWSAGEVTISLIRNQIADNYAVLVNGVPLLSAFTAGFTGSPTVAPGAAFIMAPVYTVNNFKIRSVKFTSTQTVFSAVWNFLHSVSSAFTGSAALTRDHLRTKRGPLVKGWGDSTPATVQDVTVTINGVDVPLGSVNPYIGKVYPTIPIPLTPPGTATVEVDYKWFPSPTMEMAGLNTEGLILNKFDQPTGHTYEPVSPVPVGSTGAADTHRFPMGVVLGPLERRAPVLIGHRYLGFEREYTAALNSPTTLLLNQSPRRTSLGGFTRTPEPVTVNYDGNTSPTVALPDTWALQGVDAGRVSDTEDSWILIDDSSGSFEIGEAALYVREEDLTFPSTINLTARVRADAWELDGVFTGLGFGAHDNYRMYLTGFLVINDVKHLGFLLDSSAPHLEASWELGPAVEITITSSTTFEVPSSEFPSSVDDETRFQIFDGAQAGVYEIAFCGVVPGTDGITRVTLNPSTPFPADWTQFGNSNPTIVFEVLWDEALATYRMVVDPDGRNAQVYVGGSLSGQVLNIVDPPGIPAETSLLLPTGEKGALFWGSTSRIATNTSEWTFVRYNITPDMTSFHSLGIVVAAEMSDTPDQDANNEWFITNEFGLGVIDSSGDTLLLKSTSESPDDSLDLTFGYARTEPFLTPDVAIDLDATFRVEDGVLGHGDGQIIIRDGVREARLATLLYAEVGGVRQIVELAVDSLSGLRDPVADGWTQAGTFTLSSVDVRQNKITIDQTLGERGIWRTLLDLTPASSTGRIFESTFAVTAYSANASGFVGPAFGGNSGPIGTVRPVFVSLLASVGGNPPQVVLLDDDLAIVASFDFDWTDGAFHVYRAVVDPTSSTVTLIVDDTLIGSADYTLFTLSTDTNVQTRRRAFVGLAWDDTASTTVLDAVSVSALPESFLKRTLGVYLGGDETDINNWEIPRTDSLTVPNSDLSAVVEEMDWRTSMSVRFRRDPGWGITVFRPDLPLPPYYTGDFATQITEPSAGWINVETHNIPLRDDMFGYVSFGALDPQSVTQQRWNQVRYHIFKHMSEDMVPPHHMVLNQYNVINSGEYNVDVTPEVVTVTSMTDTIVSLRPSHIFADRIFNVVVDESVLPSTSYTFDEAAQAILLTSPLPGDHYPVTVTFAPGKPVTKTYLAAQPLLDGITLLNEGTPPVPLSQGADAISEVVFGSQINDPNDTLNDDPDFILNDPFRTVEFTDDPESLYEDMEFCTLDDGNSTGLLSIACDGPSPEAGLIELALEGIGFTDCFGRPGGPAVHPGSPSIGETAGPFGHESVLHVSGGNYVDGVLGPGSAVLYRNWGGPDGYQPGQAVMNREVELHLSLNGVITGIGEVPLEETLAAPGDNVPPSAVSGDANPDGTPGATGNGACAAETSDIGDANSVVGPWAGYAALQTMSRLGGGVPLDGSELTLNTPLATPVVSSFQIEAAN
jgi:hypothetical protein